MKNLIIGLLAAVYALIAPNLAAGATSTTPWAEKVWQLKMGTVNVGQPYTGVNAEANCKAAAQTYAESRATSGNYFCHGVTGARVTYSAGPAPCTAQPSSTTATVACATGLAPPWQQTTAVTVSSPPACTVTTTRTPATAPATACQPIVAPTTWTRLGNEGASVTVPAGSTVRYGAGTVFIQRVLSGAVVCNTETFGGTDPVPNVAKVCDIQGAYTPPPVTPITLYFSDCQAGAPAGCTAGVNSAAGTQAAPKQNLTGLNINGLPAGSQLLFKRGGAWDIAMVDVENPNVTLAAPLVFGAYGTGPAPWLRTSSGDMFHFGGRWGNQTNDGGYTLIDLKIDGRGTSNWGIWFVQNVQGVRIENTEITGFGIAVNASDATPFGISNITLLNNNIHHNSDMGMLGHYKDTLIEGNTFEANNFSGSGFSHGTYLGGGSNITLRNNRYIRNSTVNGVCQGGQMTFHGQHEGLVIEGNTIEQDSAAPGCWGMSITQAYTTAEWFNGLVVRNNKLINLGNAGINVQSAPGALVEGNVIINTRPTYQAAIGLGSVEYLGGDVLDVGAIVRNNTACQSGGASGPVVSQYGTPGATLTNNVVITGAAATTGVCALP